MRARRARAGRCSTQGCFFGGCKPCLGRRADAGQGAGAAVDHRGKGSVVHRTNRVTATSLAGCRFGLDRNSAEKVLAGIMEEARQAARQTAPSPPDVRAAHERDATPPPSSAGTADACLDWEQLDPRHSHQPGQAPLIHPLACRHVQDAPDDLQVMVDGPRRDTRASPLGYPRLQDAQVKSVEMRFSLLSSLSRLVGSVH
jgi:hypothetical protein